MFSEDTCFIAYMFWNYFPPFCDLSLFYQYLLKSKNFLFWWQNYFLINKQKPLNGVVSPERGAPIPCDGNRAQQKEETFFFPSKELASEKPWTLCVISLPTSFSYHGGRPRIAILRWSQINPSLLEKHLLVYLFQINKSNYQVTLLWIGHLAWIFGIFA